MKLLLQKSAPIIFALILLTLNACKDPCKDVACLNGGACVDGTCVCANGYTGTNCEVSPNPCENINCLNGGQCINGTCVCPAGYSGVLCENMAIATKVKVTNIRLIEFPPFSSGENWDLLSLPDPFVYISKDNSSGEWLHRSDTAWNCGECTPINLNDDLPYTIENIGNQLFGIGARDDDSDQIFGVSDQMGGFQNINLLSSQFYLKNPIEIESNSVKIELTVEWQF